MAIFDSTRQERRTGVLGRTMRVPGLGAVAAVCLVAAAALLPVVQSSNVTTAGYETRRLEQRKADLQASIYNAQTEVAQLGSLERIDREARDRLGMVPADRVVMLPVTEAPQTAWHVPARFFKDAAPAPTPAPNEGGWQGLLARLWFR